MNPLEAFDIVAQVLAKLKCDLAEQQRRQTALMTIRQALTQPEQTPPPEVVNE